MLRTLRAARLLAVVALGAATAAPVASAATLDDGVELTLVSTTDTHGMSTVRAEEAPTRPSRSPLVYDERLEIRQLLIDWPSARSVIDQADFFDPN